MEKVSFFHQVRQQVTRLQTHFLFTATLELGRGAGIDNEMDRATVRMSIVER